MNPGLDKNGVSEFPVSYHPTAGLVKTRLLSEYAVRCQYCCMRRIERNLFAFSSSVLLDLVARAFVHEICKVSSLQDSRCSFKNLSLGTLDAWNRCV